MSRLASVTALYTQAPCFKQPTHSLILQNFILIQPPLLLLHHILVYVQQLAPTEEFNMDEEPSETNDNGKSHSSKEFYHNSVH